VNGWVQQRLVIQKEAQVEKVIDIKTQSNVRSKRFSRPLEACGVSVVIPARWEDLPVVGDDEHDQKFVEILMRHNLPVSSPVPLVGRYSKPRRWSLEELQACIRAHNDGIPVSIMSAALNRNPQDIMFRLLDELHEKPGGFKEVGLKSNKKWTDALLEAGRELFEAGLTAWRVAALFGVDFEGAEKLLYTEREGYGHSKKNPFSICTDHKQIINRAVISRRQSVHHALEAFAGEGRFAKAINEVHPEARLLCVEEDGATFDRGKRAHSWVGKVEWRHANNIAVLNELADKGEKFDLVDLDPFVSCREQLGLVWRVLSQDAQLFITFGGEYRRSFISTNRRAIHRRYGWMNETISNRDYLELIPSYFFGWVAMQAASHGYVLEVERCVRYPNNCRFWTSATAAPPEECESWIRENVTEKESGFYWNNLNIPRFAEVRKRDEALYRVREDGRESTQKSSVEPTQEELPL
jgi:hypothetical protein